ncbi:LLM class flavin-dependent oxidoreductase [Nocardia sp. BMG111209]|uniref:LLM class flavin-dependent oxidoreductase n=1 Tax=Nocardia sp. BMG111209 TaxID=1160137 RepID=UPI000375E17B|nr:LLM class flavin-dependent oxidoreductase [Nocardia sp. BMG111209]
MFSLRLDMRAPSIGAPAPELYATALEMCSWAESHGCLAVVICEHHGADDGYLPAPLVMAAAVAARTSTLAINTVVILPLYDPVRLAEEIAVVDLLSRGRTSFTLGLGYRPEEYEQFGVDVRRRGRIADEKLDLLRRLLAGEVVVRDGRRIRVTPRTATPGGPLLMWGGGSVAAAERAGRYGLGLLAQGTVPGMQEAYEKSARAHGHEPLMTLLPSRDTHTVLFVAPDHGIDRAWAELGSFLLHDAVSYAEWNPANETSAGISTARTIDELRETSRSHRIVSVSEAIEMVRRGEMLNLSPLCGGLPPDIAWPYLERVGETVLPAVAAASAGERSGPDLGGALGSLTATQP